MMSTGIGEDGEIIWQSEYDTYGDPHNQSGTFDNPFGYCGEYTDSESGLVYLRARMYDPSIGRFIAEDAHWNPGNMIYGDNEYNDSKKIPDIIAIIQSTNLYVYCLGNPIAYIDEDGKNANASYSLSASKQYVTAKVTTVKSRFDPGFYISLHLYRDGKLVAANRGWNNVSVSSPINNKTSYWKVEISAAYYGDTQTISSYYILFNRSGKRYPKYTDPLSGKSVKEPPTTLTKVANPEKWTNKDRIYFRKWYENTYNNGKPLDWSKYDIHHILPLAYGGTNDYDNLIVIPKDKHKEFTGWWAGY